MITPLNNSNKFIKQSLTVVKFNPSKLVESIKEELKDENNLVRINLCQKAKLITIDFDLHLSGRILNYLMNLTNSLNELYEQNIIRSFLTGSTNFNIYFNLGWGF